MKKVREETQPSPGAGHIFNNPYQYLFQTYWLKSWNEQNQSDYLSESF